MSISSVILRRSSTSIILGVIRKKAGTETRPEEWLATSRSARPRDAPVRPVLMCYAAVQTRFDVLHRGTNSLCSSQYTAYFRLASKLRLSDVAAPWQNSGQTLRAGLAAVGLPPT
jgi:hypothetical protein